jgi:adenylylsulfate kinase-like enzyme
MHLLSAAYKATNQDRMLDIARKENIRRIGAAAKLFTEAGLMVLSATISPLRAMRDEVQQACAEVIINYLRAHGYLAAIP